MTGQPLPLPGSEEFAKLFIHVNRVDPALARELHNYYRQVLNATSPQPPAREAPATTAKEEIRTPSVKTEEARAASQPSKPAPQEPAPPQEKEVPKERERGQAEKEAKKDLRKAAKPSESKPQGKEGSPDKYKRFVQQRKKAEALWRKLLETIDPNIKRWVPDIKKLRLVVLGFFVLFALVSVFWGDIKRALEGRATPAQEAAAPTARQQTSGPISPPEPPPPPNKEAEPPPQGSASESANPQAANPEQGLAGEIPPPPNPAEDREKTTEEPPPAPPTTPPPPQLPQYGGELPPPPSTGGGAPAPTPASPPPGGALITPTKAEGGGSGALAISSSSGASGEGSAGGAVAVRPSSGTPGEGKSGSALFSPGGASGGNTTSGGSDQAANASETASSYGPRLFGEGTAPSGERGSSLKEKGVSQPALYRPGGEASAGTPPDAGTSPSQKPASSPTVQGGGATPSSPSSPSSPTPSQSFSPPPLPPSLATGTPPTPVQGTSPTQNPSQPPPQASQRPSTGGTRDQGGRVEAEGELPIPFGAILKGKVLNGLVFSSDIGTLPILVRATYDGKDLIFFGGATLNPRTNRVTVRFDRAYVGNVAYVITGYLLDAKNNLGVEAKGEEIAPNLALNLIRGTLNGVKAYVDFFAKSTTTTIVPGTGVVSSSTPPPLGLTILSGLTDQLAAPPESTSIVRIWRLDPDTPVGVIVTPAGQ